MIFQVIAWFIRKFGSIAIYVPLEGSVAEWSCSGLQLRVRRFDSDPSLHFTSEKLSFVFRVAFGLCAISAVNWKKVAILRIYVINMSV